MRAVICVRVSPRPVDKVRYSPEIQESKGRAWVEERGGEVVGVIQDILVSGGASNRFDSIMRGLEEYRPTHFVVSDLSRWTRDRPSRFWAIKAILEDQGVKLVSVDEPWLDSDMPFTDTVTTARVEANYQERLRIQAKTSAGVRAAWNSGKRWGRPFGWTWHPETRTYTQDVEKILAFYQDWIDGTPTGIMARRYGMQRSNIKKLIGAVSQIEIIGQEMWDKAQLRSGHVNQRADAKKSNIYRGLLVCPFCARKLSQMGQGSKWGTYYCRTLWTPHGWRSVKAISRVRPVVQGVLDRLRLDRDEAQAAIGTPEPVTPRMSPKELQASMDRLSEAYVLGRISQPKYEKMLEDLQRQIEEPPARPVSQVELEELVMVARRIDLDVRDPEEGSLINAFLRELFVEIRFGEETTDVRPIVREQYLPLLRPDLRTL